MQKKQNKKQVSRPKTQGRRDYELPGDGKVFSYLGPRPRHLYPSTGQVFSTVQTYQTVAWATSSVTVPVFFSEQFSLANFDQYASFTAIFDQYRITSVEVYLTIQGGNLNLTNAGELTTVIDYDDANSLPSVGGALDYANSLTSSGQSCHYRRFVPHIAVAAYTGTFTGFQNKRSDWIDAASAGIQHYGFKAALGVTSSVVIYDLTVRANIDFRQVR